jgi:hypothetical protein
MKKFMPQVIVLLLTLANTRYAWADISRPPPPIALDESSLVLGAVFLSLGFVLGGLWLARKIRRNGTTLASTVETEAAMSLDAAKLQAAPAGAFRKPDDDPKSVE